jgi:hypothetical protein
MKWAILSLLGVTGAVLAAITVFIFFYDDRRLISIAGSLIE